MPERGNVGRVPPRAGRPRNSGRHIARPGWPTPIADRLLAASQSCLFSAGGVKDQRPQPLRLPDSAVIQVDIGVAFGGLVPGQPDGVGAGSAHLVEAPTLGALKEK